MSERSFGSLRSLEAVLSQAREDLASLGRMLNLDSVPLALRVLEKVLRPNVFFAPLESSVAREQAVAAWNRSWCAWRKDNIS